MMQYGIKGRINMGRLLVHKILGALVTAERALLVKWKVFQYINA